MHMCAVQTIIVRVGQHSEIFEFITFLEGLALRVRDMPLERYNLGPEEGENRIGFAPCPNFENRAPKLLPGAGGQRLGPS